MSREVKIGQTDLSVFVFVPDSAQTDGTGKTGLVAANLTVSYARMETDNDATVTDVTASLNNLAALTTAHTDWGLIEISATLAPGLYRLDIADAVFASGAWEAIVYVMITSSLASPSPLQFVMVPEDPLLGVTVPGAVGSVTGAVGSCTGSVGSVAAGGITAASFAANAINAAKLDPDVTTELQAGLATAAALTTAQNDLDILTGSDGVTLATTQANYAPLKPTVAGRTLDVSAGGEGGVDWANVGSPTTTVGLSGTTVGTLTTYTGNTPQTGDAFARLGAPAGASIAADVATRATPAQVNTEVLDVLNVDTFAEPGQGAPAATASLVAKIGYVYKAWRNRHTQTATAFKLYADDATTVDQKATLSDDGTTAERTEIATGP